MTVTFGAVLNSFDVPGDVEGKEEPWVNAPDMLSGKTRRMLGAMKIYGLSQSSGVERRLHIEQVSDGVVLIITDHVGNVERGRILVPADSLMATIMDQVDGGVTIEGTFPPNGPKELLDVEVRHNEVWLRLRNDSAEGCDVAVGFDDFQDALEKAIG
jgi:hypothetical protein